MSYHVPQGPEGLKLCATSGRFLLGFSKSVMSAACRAFLELQQGPNGIKIKKARKKKKERENERKKKKRDMERERERDPDHSILVYQLEEHVELLDDRVERRDDPIGLLDQVVDSRATTQYG